MKRWDDSFTEQIKYYEYERKKNLIISIVFLVSFVIVSLVKTEVLRERGLDGLQPVLFLGTCVFSSFMGYAGMQARCAYENRRKVSTLLDRIDVLEKKLGIKNTEAEKPDTEEKEGEGEQNE